MLTRDLVFRGHSYKIACYETRPDHASWYSFQDEASVRDAYWNIQPGDVVLDVGASFGSYTLTALACGAAFVYSWSPQGYPGETEADTLRASLKLNGWQDRCQVFNIGAYNRSGWLHTEYQQLLDSEPSPPDPYVIFVMPLDDMPQLNKVDWMKLDVEGAEVEVIQGARKLITRYRPNLLIENHLFKRPNVVQELQAVLVGELGYKEVVTAAYNFVSHSLYMP
jgi:FkbM family methyltransferase